METKKEMIENLTNKFIDENEKFSFSELEEKSEYYLRKENTFGGYLNYYGRIAMNIVNKRCKKQQGGVIGYHGNTTVYFRINN